MPLAETILTKPYTGVSPAADEVPTLTNLYKALIDLNSAIQSKGMVVQGTDGANARPLKTTTDGKLYVAGGFTATPTITRPANVTAYTAGDVIGGVTEFTNMGLPSATALITGSRLLLKLAAIPAGMTSFRLHLYRATPPSAIGDNGAWTFSNATDQDYYQGYLDIGTPAMHGAAVPFIQLGGHAKEVQLSTTGSLFTYLVTNGGFTPANNSEVYLPVLTGSQL